jgi:hypothetical protein
MSQSTARRQGRRQVQRKTTNWVPIAGVAVALVVIAVGGWLALSGGGVSGTAVVQQFPNQAPAGSSPHINLPTDPHPAYNSNPPTSGWHTGGNIGPWGVSTQPIADEITVHNLEHGGVIIHYRQNLDKGTVDQLTALTRELQQQSPCVVLLPRPADKLDTPIAVTAWTWMLKDSKFDSDTAKSIRSFFRSHVDQGPEKVGCQLRS